jgi:hypothetical protein
MHPVRAGTDGTFYLLADAGKIRRQQGGGDHSVMKTRFRHHAADPKPDAPAMHGKNPRAGRRIVR